MGEMSLRDQIYAIDQEIAYIDQLENDIKYLNQKAEDYITSLRNKGLRTEITDMVQSVYMGHINDQMGNLLSKMNSVDKEYLISVRNYLIGASQTSADF